MGSQARGQRGLPPPNPEASPGPQCAVRLLLGKGVSETQP